MITDTANMLQTLAAELRVFAEIATPTATVGLLVANLGRRRGGGSPARRTTQARYPRPVASRPSPAPASPTVAASAVAQSIVPKQAAAPRDSTTTRQGGGAAMPAIAARARGERDEIAAVYGVAELAERAGESRWRTTALQVAVQQISALAADDCVVELNLELDRHVVPVTLLTTRGVFPVLVSPRESTNDLFTITTISRQLGDSAASVAELTRLTGVPPQVIVYSPYVEAEARSWYVAGHNAFTVGGPRALSALLRSRHGPGLSRSALDAYRSAAKPHRRVVGQDIAEHVRGLDSPELST
jgi:hypothetical protein